MKKGVLIWIYWRRGGEMAYLIIFIKQAIRRDTIPAKTIVNNQRLTPEQRKD
jgi:hypothetical protein